MARSRESKIELTAYDDLFETDESRAEANLSKIREIPIAEIDEFPDHPFKVLMDEDMEQLVDSIKRSGVMTPATVRMKDDGRYELISGHRRKKACELSGLETLKCEVKELTRDEAIIVMVESNLQRTTILPSEKAFAYKMRLEAMKRQAGRPTKDNYSPVGNNSDFATSSDELAEKVGESKNQIFRYIRLTELVPEILQMVDERQIAFRPAVELSYLTEGQQYTLLEAMEYNDATPSLAQAIKMKKLMQDGKLTNEVIQSIMQEEKPNQKEKPAFKDERITKLIPKSIPRGQETDFVVKALEFYNRHLQRSKDREIRDVSFGLYTAEGLTAADGTEIPADSLLEVLSLDGNGHGKSVIDLPLGSYYVQEISTNAAYLTSDTKYPVVFAYAGQDTALVHISANEGNAIENKLIYGSVSGKKSDEDGKALGGALIGIFKTGTTEFTKETAIATTVSAEDGSFSFAKVPYGTWVIREIESPKGYVLSEEEIAVIISEVDEIVEISLVNYFIRGSISLTKVDKDYPDNKLTGAVFEVYSDTNGDGKLDKDDALLGTMTEMEGGVYQMTELRYGKYLVREKTAPTGYILDENVYPVSIEENGKTYTVENEAGKGFLNEAQKGNLKIVKTSSDGRVEGFSFRITGVNYDQTFKTDKNGEISIEGLRIGEYTVSEVSDKASAGYILPADKQAAVQTGATTIVQMHNELRDTPKTGDDFNPVLWVSLAAAFTIGAGVLGFLGIKGKKKKED